MTEIPMVVAVQVVIKNQTEIFCHLLTTSRKRVMQKESLDTAVPRTPKSSMIGVHLRRVIIFWMKLVKLSPIRSAMGTPRPFLICHRVMTV